METEGHGVFLAFVLLLTIILVSYYVGTASDILVGGKLIQQLAYFFTGRQSDGSWNTTATVTE
jgi:hypothetical protein